MSRGTLQICILASAAMLALSAWASAEPVATRSPVADSAEQQDWDRVHQLLSRGVDAAAAQPDGTTALHWAVLAADDATIDALLARDQVDVDASTRYGVRPLHIACLNGDVATLRKLFGRHADPHLALPGGELPIHIAARVGSVACIDVLVANGADVNGTDDRGQTPLMWAAAQGHRAATDALLRARANARATLPSGFSPLMFAARGGHTEVARRLLDAGVDIHATLPAQFDNRAPRGGTSALMLAVENAHYATALMLIAAGADPNDQRSGLAPLHAVAGARKTGRGDNPAGDPPPRGSGPLTSLQFVRELVATGADVNLPLSAGKDARAMLDMRGATPCFTAARTADLPLLKLLVELGGDPLRMTNDGTTPLMAAAGVGVQAVDEEPGTEPEVLETVAYLIEQGTDVNAIDVNRETAMHGAAYRNFPAVVDLLADRGADPARWDHQNAWGWTPFRIAEGYRPGSLKPSPETQAAIRRALQRTPRQAAAARPTATAYGRASGS